MIAIIVLWILLGIIAFIVILLHFSVRAYIKADSGGIDIKVKYLFFTVYPRPKKAKKTKRTNKSKSDKKSEEDLFNDSLDDELSEVKDEGLEEPKLTYEQSADELDEVTSEQDNSVSDEHEKESEDNKEEPKEPDEKPEKAEVMKEEPKEKCKKEKKSEPFASLKAKYLLVKPYIPTGWKAVKKLLKTIRITDLRIQLNVGREDAHEAVIYYGAIQGALFNLLSTLAAIFTVKIKKADVNCVFVKNTISGEGEAYIKIRPSAIIAIAVCTAVNFLIIFLRQRKKKRREKEQIEKAAQNAEPVTSNQ